MRFSIAKKVSVLIIFILSWIALNGQSNDGVIIATHNVGPFAQANGKQTIYGAIENFSTSIVSDLDIAWRVNNGEIHISSFGNLNLGNWTKFIFEHKTPWQIGNADSYLFKFWVDKVNGETIENIDTLIIPVEALSQTSKRTVLIESFSSIDCASCAAVNPPLREISEKFKERSFTIAYQIDCYSNNPMCLLAENSIFTRVDLYEIVSTPNIVINNWYRGNSTEYLDLYISAELERPSPIGIAGTYNVLGEKIEIECSISPHFPISTEKLTAFIAFTEDIVSFDSPPGGNGESTFFHILRRISKIPATLIDPISLGESTSFTINEDFGSLGIDFNQLRVAVIIQDTSSLEIIQAFELTPIQTGVMENQSGKIKIFPNPAINSLYISIDDSVSEDITVKLVDPLGKVLYKNGFKSSSNPIEISTKNLNSGMYLLLIQGENFSSMNRVIIN